MDCSMLGLPVPHHLPKFAQVHVHGVSDAIRPSTSSSDALFSFCPQTFPASGMFPMSQLFAFDDQNTGASATASVLPTRIQGWTPLRLTGLISMLPKGLRSLLQHHSLEASILWCSAFFTVRCSQPHVITGKATALTVQTFVGRVTSLLLNTLSKFVTGFLPRSRRLLASQLQS